MIQVIDSFLIRDRGIIVILEHEENGIPPDTILKEKSGSITWKIKSRILNGLLLINDKEITFNNETVINHISQHYSSPKQQEHALLNFIKKREDNIFEYMLYTKPDNSKPLAGMILYMENY